MRGYIFHATTTGRPSSGTVKYQKLWPVLKDGYGGDLTGLVDRIITRDTTADDQADLKAYFVQAESFFILGNRAWWADRFNLYSGVLSGGKNFRGTSAIVANVPKDKNPSGDYNHIFRCFVRKLTGGSYEMLTEERRMRLGSLGSNYWNWRAVINKYTSADLKTWAFSETLKEDDRLDYIDYDHHLGATGLSLPPYSNLPRELSHIKYTGTEQVTRLGYYLIFVEGGIEIRQKGNKQRAWLNYGGVNYTFVSTDGIYWRYESFGTVYEKDGSTVSSGFAHIVTPPVL